LGLLSFCSFAQIPGQPRDGKLLQGDLWLPFSYPEKADFYVSMKGRDDWSGTMPEPNVNNTDGPFLTIARAQKAVRELKSRVFFPKDPPVEKRWIGSSHPFGRGKDILVYIREELYLDGKVYEKKLLPAIKNNSRKIEFEIRIYDEGEHQLAIGPTPYQPVKIEGDKPSVVFEDFKISDTRLMEGEKLKVTATAKNLTSESQKMKAKLFLDHSEIKSQDIELNGKAAREISVEIDPPAGNHTLRIENGAEKCLTVFEAVHLDISFQILNTRA